MRNFIIVCKGTGKAAATETLIGCSWDEMLHHQHDQLQHNESMSEMHADHIFPFAMYDVSKADQQRRVSNFSNVQPLTEAENLYKSDKLPTKAMAAKVARWAWPDGVTEDMLPDIYDGWATPLRMRASE